VDNLAQFKPHIKPHEMDDEVTNFEESILFFADAYNRHGPGSQINSPISSGVVTPSLTPGDSTTSSAASSRAASRSNSFTATPQIRRPSFGTRLSNMLRITSMPALPETQSAVFEDPVMEEVHDTILENETTVKKHQLSAWQIEACAVDRSVQILPGVKRVIDSIPNGRYAVATSGAKTYAYGCMTRVGITPPPVTITADDKRLKAGKPAPDPFLLAAKCLGFDAKKCIVFEDSPSGIRAGVASGATVIAVCTSHERSKIEHCGAHFIVENMEKIHCEPVGERAEMKLKFTISA